jgi:Protein of unknown function with PCYCGC motif
VSGRVVPWIVAGAAAAALAVVLVTGRGQSGHHPDPRSGVTAIGVLPDAAVPVTPGSLEAYAAARSAPAVLDGLYCYCHCRETAGHRSLLTCFESDHGAYCDMCMGEAVLAVRMASQGAALAQIRQAIDARFGS